MADRKPHTARARASHATPRIGRMQTNAAHTSALSAPKSSLMTAHVPKLAHARPKTVELRGSTGALATSRGTRSPKARPPIRPPTTVSARLDEPSLTRAGPTKQPRAHVRFNVSRRRVPPKMGRMQHGTPAAVPWQALHARHVGEQRLQVPLIGRFCLVCTRQSAVCLAAHRVIPSLRTPNPHSPQHARVHKTGRPARCVRRDGRPELKTLSYFKISWPESSLPRTRPRVRAMPRLTPWIGVE